MLKTVDQGYRSSLSVAWIVRIWFKSFQNSTFHKTSLVQGSLLLLAVYTHEVPLCLCSVFLSRSQVRFSTPRYRAFRARTTPRTVSRNLKLANTSHAKKSYAAKIKRVNISYAKKKLHENFPIYGISSVATFRLSSFCKVKLKATLIC